MEAFQRGLHVMVEKPAGVYTKKVREMNEAAKRAGVVFGMMFNQRTNHVYRKMKELVDSGELGAIRRTNWLSPIGTGPRRITIRDPGGLPGRGRAAACCLTNAPITWICGSGSAACPSRCRPICSSANGTTSEVEDDVTA